MLLLISLGIKSLNARRHRHLQKYFSFSFQFHKFVRGRGDLEPLLFLIFHFNNFNPLSHLPHATSTKHSVAKFGHGKQTPSLLSQTDGSTRDDEQRTSHHSSVYDASKPWQDIWEVPWLFNVIYVFVLSLLPSTSLRRCERFPCGKGLGRSRPSIVIW